jgi:hypothetical protein
MMGCMRRILVAVVFTLATLALPLVSHAQDEPTMIDARREGYVNPVTIGSGSTALQWLMVILLSALCLGVMFKSANRSHLD